jgi:hypothetical protein
VSSNDLVILWWPSQSLIRKTYVVSHAEVPILGINIDTVSTDAFGIATVFLLLLLGLRNQILRFVESVPADSMKEGKGITHRITDLRTKFTCGSCFATNDGSNVSLNQVEYAIGDAAC